MIVIDHMKNVRKEIVLRGSKAGKVLALHGHSGSILDVSKFFF